MDLEDELDDFDGGDGYDNNYGAGGNGEDGMGDMSSHLACVERRFQNQSRS